MKCSELPTCDDTLLWDIWHSVNYLPSLTVADELGLFEYIDSNPSSSDDIAEKFSISSRSSEALLGLLTSLGFFKKINNLFKLTDVSRNYLLPKSPFYWGGVLHSVIDVPIIHSALLNAIKADLSNDINAKNTSFKYTDIWGKNELTREHASIFTAKMHSHAFATAMFLAKHINLKNVKKFLDVGGGSGCYCIAFSKQYPDIHYTVADLSLVCDEAKIYIDQYCSQSNIDTYPLDMFKDVWPNAYDAIFFSDIFHDWSMDKCYYLCKRSFESLQSGGRIFIHEILINTNNVGPLTANSYSVSMLIATEGKQYSKRELTDLMLDTGFIDVSIMKSYGYYSLISATKK